MGGPKIATVEKREVGVIDIEKQRPLPADDAFGVELFLG